MTVPKLEALKALRDNLKADQIIDNIVHGVTAVQKNHPDRLPQLLDCIIEGNKTAAQASDNDVKKRQAPPVTTQKTPLLDQEFRSACDKFHTQSINRRFLRNPNTKPEDITTKRSAPTVSDESDTDLLVVSIGPDFESMKPIDGIPTRRPVKVTLADNAPKPAGPSDNMARKARKVDEVRKVNTAGNGRDDNELLHKKVEKVDKSG